MARSATTIVSFPVFWAGHSSIDNLPPFWREEACNLGGREGERKKKIPPPSEFRLSTTEKKILFLSSRYLHWNRVRVEGKKEGKKENEVARRVAAAVQKPEPISIHPKKISSTLPICYYMSPAASKFKERERGRDGGTEAKKKRRVKTARAKKPIPTEKRGSRNYEQMPRFSFISKI